MGSLGDCFDNAMCESFFATLECELLARTRFETREQASRAIFSFIEGWYNPHRRHSKMSMYMRDAVATTVNRSSTISIRQDTSRAIGMHVARVSRRSLTVVGNGLHIF
ncbi:hypothetical protein WT56_29675 [Burkholderia pseudomultivorans]|uniref:Integrase catalytic domain-containing protein n=1 Tax=Burkholderia pseudomultivorans TaxID=1207504 RepID=A0A132E8I8_9BURK|nr:hypothetical protein WT56_29675 [Burkholderia pseudomultivorans]